jgi:hypothetical protein
VDENRGQAERFGSYVALSIAKTFRLSSSLPVGVARRRVAGEAGFDVTYLRRRSEGPAVRPIVPLTPSLNLR